MMADQEPTRQEEIAKLEAENAQLRNEILSRRQFNDSMQNLVDALEDPKPKFEIMDLLSEVLENALETIHAKDGSLLVLDEETQELVFVVTHGELSSEMLHWRRLPAGDGIAGWVVENQKATIVNDAQSDGRFYSNFDDEFNFETHSVLAAPIVGGGQVLGVVEVLNKQDNKLFNSDDQTLLTLMCRFSGELLTTVIQRTSPPSHDTTKVLKPGG